MVQEWLEAMRAVSATIGRGGKNKKDRVGSAEVIEHDPWRSNQ
jgi:hypothetical protein